MTLRRLAALSLLGLSLGAGATAVAHPGHGPKRNPGQCQALLDEELRDECVSCVKPGGHHFHPEAEAGKRCYADEDRR